MPVEVLGNKSATGIFQTEADELQAVRQRRERHSLRDVACLAARNSVLRMDNIAFEVIYRGCHTCVIEVGCRRVHHFHTIVQTVPLHVQRLASLARTPVASCRVAVIIVGLPYE